MSQVPGLEHVTFYRHLGRYPTLFHCISKSFPTCPEWLDSTWQYLPLLRLLRDSSVVWDLYRLTCGGGFWTPPWLTWCGLSKHLKSSWKRSRKRTHTPTHTHTLLTYSLVADAPMHRHTFSCVSHTNTLEVLLHLQHLIPCPSLPTIKPCW